MLNKAAKASRQSPMQKAVAFGENALRIIGGVKGAWEAGKAVAEAGRVVYQGVQTVAPYAQAAVAML